jgi:ATP-dependent Clp protease ATP-binding subunit ClpA
MLEHFGDEARSIVRYAARDARRRGCRVVGTGAVLAALIEQQGEEARVRLILRELRVNERAVVRAELAAEDEAGAQARLFDPPFSASLRHAVALAEREAARRLDATIGPDDVFVGLLASRSGVAAQVLSRVGVDLRSVRRVGTHR